MRRLVIFAAAALAASACRTPLPPLERLPADDPRPARLLEGWERVAGARHAMRGRARLSVDGGDGAVRLRSRQLLVLERPARLRVEIQGLLSQTVAVLVTDGERYELFRADDRSYQAGPVHPGLLWEQAYLDLTPAEAIELLLGSAASDPSLTPLAAYADGDGGVQLDLADARGRLRRRLHFDAQGRLRALEVSDEGGDVLWQAEFDDYERVGAAEFAHRLGLQVARGDARVQITLEDVELNPELPPDIFRLRVPAEASAATARGG